MPIAIIFECIIGEIFINLVFTLLLSSSQVLHMSLTFKM